MHLADPPSHIASSWRSRTLHLYRCSVLILIAVLVHQRHASRIPPTVKPDELKDFFPTGTQLKESEAPNLGVAVFDAKDERVGRVMLTLPACKNIIGYSGNTDALIAMDEDDRILGVAIRSSEDTARYVDDVAQNRLFLKSWDGMSMRKAVKLGVDGAGIDGVSGATATSRAVARSVAQRLALAQGQPPPRTPHPL